MNSPQEIWETALGQIQLQVNKPNYDTWLRDTTGVSYQDDIFVVGVPNVFIAEWLRNRLYSLIKRTLSSVIGKNIRVQFAIRQPSQSAHLTPAYQTDGGLSTKSTESMPMHKLNPKYTFDTFVAGECNRLAYAAALAVSEEPGQRYNPLLIYGDTGIGKTHLMHAIGNATKAKGLHTVLVTGEQFTNEFVGALKSDRMDDFHRKFRSADVLLVDDVHFLIGKMQTQECMVHIFNDLHDNNHQIVLTSDRVPKAMPSISRKLRSRLECGLVADISPPDLETRLAILKASCEQLDLPIPPEVTYFVAMHFHRNVRELQGALNRVYTYAKLSATKLDMRLAMKALSDMIPTEDTRQGNVLPPKLIIEAVANHYGTTPEALAGKQRDRKITLARHVAMYLLREQNHCTLAEIGKLLGNRDHTTVLHGYMKVATEINLNPNLTKSIRHIQGNLQARKT